MTVKQLHSCLINKKQFIPYFTYGDMSESFTHDLVCQTFEQGIDIVELGFPFSDPIADGEVIQDSHQRALKNKPNLNLNSLFSMTKLIKKKFPNKYIIIMLAVNLVIQYDIEAFFESANDSGISGVIIPDLNIDSADSYRENADKNKIGLINLVSPLCDIRRLKKIVMLSSGFVYLISSLGTTGERSSFSKKLESLTAQIKTIKPIAVGVGFGISQTDHIKSVYQFADAAIVGSHLISLISKNYNSPKTALTAIHKRIKTLLT
tara:strand:- start:1007 stop:1795 length:789 start_codon:yes stop_codon:yes gene_type:complete